MPERYDRIKAMAEMKQGIKNVANKIVQPVKDVMNWKKEKDKKASSQRKEAQYATWDEVKKTNPNDPMFNFSKEENSGTVQNPDNPYFKIYTKNLKFIENSKK